jgi:hypothetical protein
MQPFDSLGSAWEWGCYNSNGQCEMLVNDNDGLYVFAFPFFQEKVYDPNDFDFFTIES